MIGGDTGVSAGTGFAIAGVSEIEPRGAAGEVSAALDAAPTAISTSPFSTFTGYEPVARVAGIVRAAPVRMSNFAPCRGQAIA